MERSLFDPAEDGESGGEAQDARVDPGAPLAERMRPQTLDEVLGQDHLIGPGRVLRRAVEEDSLRPLIFWGPPGTGKTTLCPLPRRRPHAPPPRAGPSSWRRREEGTRPRPLGVQAAKTPSRFPAPARRAAPVTLSFSRRSLRSRAARE